MMSQPFDGRDGSDPQPSGSGGQQPYDQQGSGNNTGGGSQPFDQRD